MGMRFLLSLACILLAGAFCAAAQTQDHKPVDPTSATDHDAKLHDTKKIFRFHRKHKTEARGTEGKVIGSAKRNQVQARATERPGRSIPKTSSRTRSSGNHARVFRRHGNGAAKNAERVRRANRRQMLE